MLLPRHRYSPLGTRQGTLLAGGGRLEVVDGAGGDVLDNELGQRAVVHHRAV